MARAWVMQENGSAERQEVRPLDQSGNMVYVELGDGRTAWLAPHEFDSERSQQ